MSESHETARRTTPFGVVLIVLELAIQQSGFAGTTELPALAAAFAVATAGSIALALYNSRRAGLGGIREFDRAMWEAVGRLAFSNTLISVAYIFAAQRLGLGPVAAITALGPISVGFNGIVASLSSDRPASARAWGRKQLGLRVLALLGVIVLTQPWMGLAHIDFVGLGWAIAAAWCFWNYIKCVFGIMTEQGRVIEGLTVANLIAVPAIALVVWPFGGWGEMSWHVLIFGGVFGLLIVFIPALFQAPAGKRVTERDAGLLYLLDSPIAAGIGAGGVFLGLLAEAQAPHWGWIGIPTVFVAALVATLLGNEPSGAEG